MIKAIIFDCFGVLTADFWREFTGTLTPVQREKATLLNHQYDSGLMTADDFFQAIQQATGRPIQEIKAARNSDMNKNTELFNYIRSLKSNFKIGLLSNVATNWIKDEFLSKEEKAIFDDIVMSFEVGLTKPDPRIFELTCQRLGAEAEEVVFVDDMDRYCIAARTVGMQSIVYQDFTQFKHELDKILSQN